MRAWRVRVGAQRPEGGFASVELAVVLALVAVHPTHFPPLATHEHIVGGLGVALARAPGHLGARSWARPTLTRTHRPSARVARRSRTDSRGSHG